MNIRVLCEKNSGTGVLFVNLISRTPGSTAEIQL